MHPTGPQPPRVYWVRRALVLGVLLLLLLGVRHLLRAAGHTAPASAPQASAPATSPAPAPSYSAPAVSTSAPATATAPPTRTAAAAPTTTSSTPQASPSGPPACTRSQIAVTASTDAASYKVGATPRLRMRIQNVSSTACTRDIGALQNTLLITSGSAHVWSSDDCNPGGTPQVVTMAPGQSFSVSVTWLGRLSQKGCPPNQPMATGGTYRLTGRNGAVVSAPAVFALT